MRGATQEQKARWEAVLRLYESGQFTYKSLATLLGIHLSTLDGMIFRARRERKIKEMLAKPYKRRSAQKAKAA